MKYQTGGSLWWWTRQLTLSNNEKMVFCLRHIDDQLEVHEDVFGLYTLEPTSTDSIVLTVKDILLRLNPGSTNGVQ